MSCSCCVAATETEDSDVVIRKGSRVVAAPGGSVDRQMVILHPSSHAVNDTTDHVPRTHGLDLQLGARPAFERDRLVIALFYSTISCCEARGYDCNSPRMVALHLAAGADELLFGDSTLFAALKVPSPSGLRSCSRCLPLEAAAIPVHLVWLRSFCGWHAASGQNTIHRDG